MGAGRRTIIREVMVKGSRLAGLGILIGLTGSFALTRLMSSLLFGIGLRDPLTILVVAASLALVALVATYLPARGATQVDPVVALRRY